MLKGYMVRERLGTLALNRGPVGLVGWRAVFPIKIHEFLAGRQAACRAAENGRPRLMCSLPARPVVHADCWIAILYSQLAC